MWPIALCALVAAGLIAWKLIELSMELGRSSALLVRADTLVGQHMIAEAHALARESDTPAGRALAAGLARRTAGPERVGVAIGNAELLESARLERGLMALAAIATVAPLLGALASTHAALRRLHPIDGVATIGLTGVLAPVVAGLLLALLVSLVHMWLVGRIDRFAADVRRTARGAVDALRAMDSPR